MQMPQTGETVCGIFFCLWTYSDTKEEKRVWKNLERLWG